MSEPAANLSKTKLRLRSFSSYLAVALCASIVISSAWFIVFLNIVVRGRIFITVSDAPFVWIIPFLACLAGGGAMGNVKSAIKLVLPIAFLSMFFTLVLTSLPVVFGIFANVALSNEFVLSVLSSDSYLFLLAIAPIFAGTIIGAFLGGK